MQLYKQPRYKRLYVLLLLSAHIKIMEEKSSP